VANRYLQDCQTATGTPFRLVAAPVQFNEEPAVPERAPEFNENGDSILADIGLDTDAILDLKIRGVVA
jgi:crotonobetainyl-CoA:carnitine CoA-transferase CaiB-like acyl-CoA transferase